MLVFGILLISLMGFVCANGNGQGNGQDNTNANGQIIGGQTDSHGCLTAAGYSWNETEQKCVREWEHGKERYQDKIGEFAGGVKVEKKEGNKTRLRDRNLSADCDECNLNEENETDHNQTFNVHFKNGKNALIKIMPDTAAARALERLRLKVCSSDNNCTIQLKDVGQRVGDNETQTRAAYEIQIERHARILGIFKAKLVKMAQVDAETGEIIKVKKPWWAFIAIEPDENTSEINSSA